MKKILVEDILKEIFPRESNFDSQTGSGNSSGGENLKPGGNFIDPNKAPGSFQVRKARSTSKFLVYIKNATGKAGRLVDPKPRNTDEFFSKLRILKGGMYRIQLEPSTRRTDYFDLNYNFVVDMEKDDSERSVTMRFLEYGFLFENIEKVTPEYAKQGIGRATETIRHFELDKFAPKTPVLNSTTVVFKHLTDYEYFSGLSQSIIELLKESHEYLKNEFEERKNESNQIRPIIPDEVLSTFNSRNCSAKFYNTLVNRPVYCRRMYSQQNPSVAVLGNINLSNLDISNIDRAQFYEECPNMWSTEHKFAWLNRLFIGDEKTRITTKIVTYINEKVSLEMEKLEDFLERSSVYGLYQMIKDFRANRKAFRDHPLVAFLKDKMFSNTMLREIGHLLKPKYSQLEEFIQSTEKDFEENIDRLLEEDDLKKRQEQQQKRKEEEEEVEGEDDDDDDDKNNNEEEEEDLFTPFTEQMKKKREREVKRLKKLKRNRIDPEKLSEHDCELFNMSRSLVLEKRVTHASKKDVKLRKKYSDILVEIDSSMRHLWDPFACIDNCLSILLHFCELKSLVEDIFETIFFEVEDKTMGRLHVDDRDDMAPKTWKRMLMAFNRAHLIELQEVSFRVNVIYRWNEMRMKDPTDPGIILMTKSGQYYKQNEFNTSFRRRLFLRSHLYRELRRRSYSSVGLSELGVKILLSIPPIKNEKDSLGTKLVDVGTKFGLKVLRIFGDPQFYQFGFCHASVMVGNIGMHWLSNSLVTVTNLGFGYFEDVVACDLFSTIVLDGHKIVDLLRKLSDEITNSNINTEYSHYHIQGEHKGVENCQAWAARMVGHCQVSPKYREVTTYFHEFKVIMEEFLKQQSEQIPKVRYFKFDRHFHSKFFKKEEEDTKKKKKLNIGDSRSRFGSGVLKSFAHDQLIENFSPEGLNYSYNIFKFVGYESYRVYFKTHEELDLFYRLCLDIDPDFDFNYPGYYNLLKSFDRGYWCRLLKYELMGMKNIHPDIVAGGNGCPFCHDDILAQDQGDHGEEKEEGKKKKKKKMKNRVEDEEEED